MQRQRVDGQAAFVLHCHAYRETSLIVEAFSRDFGRVALLARGARRPRSALRGLLMGFQPLELAWAGKGEVLTLMKAEWQGGIPLLAGQSLYCAYYLNELLLKLLPREDAHPALFDGYRRMLESLGASAGQVDEADLRLFEKLLLQELGYGLNLSHDRDGEPIEAGLHYHYRIEEGAVRLPAAGRESVLGKTLLDLDSGTLGDARSRQEAKQLMRLLLSHYLSGAELETRKIFKELQEL